MGSAFRVQYLMCHVLMLLCLQLIKTDRTNAFPSLLTVFRFTSESAETNNQTQSHISHSSRSAPLRVDSICPLTAELSSKSDSFQEGFQHQDGEWTERLPWKCAPCFCYRTKNGFTYADCSSMGLKYFPRMLPKMIHFINMSSNLLTFLNTSELSFYENLYQLDLSKNRIRSIHGHFNGNASSSLLELILSQNVIEEICQGSFIDLSRLQTLILSSNKIRSLNNTTFQGLSVLTKLDLSKNRISHIYNGSFDELSNLRSLYLNHNMQLGYSKNLAPHILKNLTNLRELRIQGSSNANVYPSSALSMLINLESLNIDGLKDGSEFGPLMLNLTKLKALNFGPGAHCRFKNISASFFQYVPYLTSLSFINCDFVYINPQALGSLKNLSRYVLTSLSTYDLDLAFESLKAFQNSSLKSLSFIRLYHTTSPCRTLNITHGEYLRYLNIETLDLSRNRLALLGNAFISAIPKTLKYLILTENKFTLDAILWNRLSELKNLLQLDMRYQDFNVRYHRQPMLSFDLWQKLPQEEQNSMERAMYMALVDNIDDKPPTKSTQPSIISLLGQEHRYPSPQGEKIQEDNVAYKELDLSHELRLPPKLQKVLATEYLFFGGYLLAHKKWKPPFVLSDVDFSHNFLADWSNFRMPYTIKSANLSHNECFNIKPQFFPTKNNLTDLFLQFNYLGPVIHKDKKGEIFENLKTLQTLDLSRNIIFELPSKIFRGLKALKVLKMADNKLKYVNITLSHMTNLTYFDLSKNSIMWISRKVRNDLDTLAKNHRISLDLTDNSLPCTCSGREIIKWMSSTNVTLVKRYKLKCTDENGYSSVIGDLKAKVKFLEMHCANSQIFIMAAAMTGTIMIMTFAVALAVKYKWRLIYAKNKILVKLYGYKPKRKIHSKLKYDAYIVYSNIDSDFVFDILMPELEIKRGHRLCIEDRDFLPGAFSYNTITCAVQNSAHTILIISPDVEFRGDFMYAMQMAIMEDYNNKDKDAVCQILFLEDSSSRSLPKELLVLMTQERYVELPPFHINPTSDMIKEFWDRLSRKIGHYGVFRRQESTLLIPDG